MPYNQDKIGYQKSDASQQAAKHNRTGKLTIRQQVYNVFLDGQELTAEEMADFLNRAEISVKPRITELKNDGLICDSGKRKTGRWGTSLTVWKIS